MPAMAQASGVACFCLVAELAGPGDAGLGRRPPGGGGPVCSREPLGWTLAERRSRQYANPFADLLTKKILDDPAAVGEKPGRHFFGAVAALVDPVDGPSA